MALARFTRHCLSMVYRKTSCDVNKVPLTKAQRNFSVGKVCKDKSKENKDLIEVDSLSKICLVAEGKYKSLKAVPAFLPYGTVYKARDKFRIKASVGTSLFLVLLMLYSINKNQKYRRNEEYIMLRDAEEARAEAERKK